VGNRRGEPTRTGIAAILSGLGITALGLLYANYAFGPAEAWVAMWGTVAFFTGLAIAVGALSLRGAGAESLGVMLITGLGALWQVPPILWWSMLSGSYSLTGTSATPFVARGVYALVHAIIAALCVAAVRGVARSAGGRRDPTIPGELT
jgi:hypothetical protein